MKLYTTILVIMIAFAANAQVAIISVEDFKALPDAEKAEAYTEAKTNYLNAVQTFGETASQVQALRTQLSDLAPLVPTSTAKKQTAQTAQTVALPSEADLRKEYSNAVAKYGKDSKQAASVKQKLKTVLESRTKDKINQ